MNLILFVVSLILIVIGISLTAGFGWALIILDLITQSSSGTNYQEAQKTSPPSKNKHLFKGGILITIIGIGLLFYSLTLS